jgi:hypothetical protein
MDCPSTNPTEIENSMFKVMMVDLKGLWLDETPQPQRLAQICETREEAIEAIEFFQDCQTAAWVENANGTVMDLPECEPSFEAPKPKTHKTPWSKRNRVQLEVTFCADLDEFFGPFHQPKDWEEFVKRQLRGGAYNLETKINEVKIITR